MKVKVEAYNEDKNATNYFALDNLKNLKTVLEEINKLNNTIKIPFFLINKEIKPTITGDIP